MESRDKETVLFRFTPENYNTIFNTCWRKLYIIAYRRLRDAELAKDMVQEVFVYCWQQRDVIQITTSPEAYLRSALKYQLVAHFRKLEINSRAFAYLYGRMTEVEAQVRDTLTEQDLAKTLNNELAHMPDTMREIFKLRIQDYSVIEIARALNLAEKTVRNNISKGMQRIRKAISRDFPGDFSAICYLLYLLLT